jgi:putative nucleotidyltransferase with HDIG domain
MGLLDKAELPQNIVEHCIAVAALSHKLAALLNKKGCFLDAELCRRAGLLHDICRQESEHDLKGYELLLQEGLFKEADITRSHMGRDISADKITENEVVFLADKLMLGTDTVTLNQRFDRALYKYGHDRNAERDINEKYNCALAVKKLFDKVLQADLYNLINQTK